MTPTACITAQYKSVAMRDFKVKEGAENMLIRSTVGSFILMKSPIRKEVSQFRTVSRNVPMVKPIQDQTTETTKHAIKLLPSFSLSCDIAEVFTKWLTGSGGGYKKDRAAQQIVTRCFKFLRFCCEDEEELTFEVVDFSLCSPNLLLKFIDYLQDECKLGHGGRLGYIDAISEINDRLQKTSRCIRGSLSKVLCDRVVPQKSEKDSCKDDAIAVDTRLRH